MTNEFIPTKMVSKLADEEQKMYNHYHARSKQNVTMVTYTIDHAAKVNVATGTVESLQTSEAISRRVTEINSLLTGLTDDEKFDALENLRKLFFKRLSRAKQSHMNPAIADAYNLLAAVRQIKVELTWH